MVPIGELNEYAKSGLPTAAKGIVTHFGISKEQLDVRP